MLRSGLVLLPLIGLVRARELGRRTGGEHRRLGDRRRRVHHLRPHRLHPHYHPDSPHRVRHRPRLGQRPGGGQRAGDAVAGEHPGLRGRAGAVARGLLLQRSHLGGDAAARSARGAGPGAARGAVRRAAGDRAAPALPHHERAEDRHLLGGQREAADGSVRRGAPARTRSRNTGRRSSASTSATTTAARTAGAGRRSPRRRSPRGRRTRGPGCRGCRSACG